MVGSLVLGIKIALNMKARLRALRELERIISYIEGELRYRHAVLNEALYNVSLKCGHPFDMWLGDLSQRLKVDDNSRVGEDDDVFDSSVFDAEIARIEEEETKARELEDTISEDSFGEVSVNYTPMSEQEQMENHNDEIISLYKKGRSVLEISKMLSLGQGEVKFVIDLYNAR